MRFETTKTGSMRRILCVLLCLSLVFSVLFLSACNNEEPEATEPEGTEEKAQESAFELNENGKVNVVVFTEDTPRGTRVTKDNTTTIELNVANVPKNIVTDFLKVKGLYTDTDFYAGDYLIKSRLVEEKPLFVDYSTLNADLAKTMNDFLVVTDYVVPNTGKDLYTNLQTLIDLNPGRTLYFPDGEYQISKTLETTSVAELSNSFYFSSGAVLKAHEDWLETERPLIGLGAKAKENDILTPGSNFYVMGGMFDGSGIANGITIYAGRETLIKDVLIMNTRYGIHIPSGTNGNSSDADIDDVTIIGNGEYNSKGIYMTALDNTITDARISNVDVGIDVPNGVFVGNCTVVGNPDMTTSTGIRVNKWDAWVSNCMVINCNTAYSFDSPRGYISQSTAKWTVDNGKHHIAFKFFGQLHVCIVACKAEFIPGTTNNTFLVANAGGVGEVTSPMFDVNCVTGDMTKAYLTPGTSVIALPAAVSREN